MSYYVTHENSVLNINNAHLKVSGNVQTDVMKLGAIEFAPPESDVPGTVNFTNVTTGVTTTSNLNVGGTLMLGSVELAMATNALEQTVNLGNTTSNTVQFTNATTGLVATGNVEVGGELTVSGNVEVGTANLFVDTVNSRIGIGTVSPGEKLHVNGNLRLGSSLNDTVDDDANRSISTAGQLTIKANDSGVNNSYVNLFLQAGKTNPGKIVIGGGDASASSNPDVWRDIEFYTSGSSTERMRIHHDGNVGINTSSPGRRLEVYTGNGAIPGLRLRRYPTGATYTDFQHADSTSPANSKEGLAIITSDGNATSQEVMRVCGNGFVGIATTNPHRTLDVQAPARPSTYPFAIGGSWNNRAHYVAKTHFPGVNKSSYTIDFLIGGSERPGWLRACAGGSQSGSGTLAAHCIAEFIISPYGSNFHWSRRFGDSAISLGSSGTHNGGRITVSHGHTSYPRLWFEIYHEYGVYW